jgi:hypothetical protein
MVLSNIGLPSNPNNALQFVGFLLMAHLEEKGWEQKLQHHNVVDVTLHAAS